MIIEFITLTSISSNIFPHCTYLSSQDINLLKESLGYLKFYSYPNNYAYVMICIRETYKYRTKFTLYRVNGVKIFDFALFITKLKYTKG